MYFEFNSATSSKLSTEISIHSINVFDIVLICPCLNSPTSYYVTVPFGLLLQ